MKEWINDGITYPLYNLPEEECQEDLQAMLAWGNHKPAIVNAELALLIAGNSFGSGRELGRELFCTRGYVGSYIEYDINVTFPQGG
jgi:hypothetical protein